MSPNGNVRGKKMATFNGIYAALLALALGAAREALDECRRLDPECKAIATI